MPSILDVPMVRRQAVPISVETYHVLTEMELLDKRTELLRGVIVNKMSKSPLHFTLVQKLAKLLTNAMPPGFHVRQEGPLSILDSEPEPDVAVVRGGADDYADEHPRTALLVVEVAVSSEEVDREKASIYAEAGVPEFWLVLPAAGVIEVFSQPREGAYQMKRVARRGETVESAALPALRVELEKLLA